MTMFPGHTEITCPCCGRYRHYNEEEIPTLAKRGYKHPKCAVCDDCWKVVQHFVRKANAKHRAGS